MPDSRNNTAMPDSALLQSRPLPLSVDRATAAYVLKDEGLKAAAHTALLLGQPLILAGEPGVGKTRFARKFAELCEIEMMPEIHVSTTTEGRQLLYTFDEVKRFRDKDKRPLAHYVNLTSFGRSILWSAGPQAQVTIDPGVDLVEAVGKEVLDGLERPLTLGDIFDKEFAAQSGRRVKRLGEKGGVVTLTLLDEFDKAPRDAPNDMLGIIENMSFRIEEIGLTITADPKAWPILLITSNSERSLPDAFLRRCIFYWIAFPDQRSGLLQEIVASHCRGDEIMRGDSPGTPEEESARIAAWRDSDLVGTSVRLLYELRDQVVNKKPATAELLGFVSALLAAGVKPSDQVTTAHPAVAGAIGTLLKTKEDLRKLGYLKG